MQGSRVGQGVRTPLKNHKNIGFLSNTGPDPMKNQIRIQYWTIIGPPVDFTGQVSQNVLLKHKNV